MTASKNSSHDLAAEKGQKLIAAAHVLEAVKQLGWEDGSDLAKLLKGELSGQSRLPLRLLLSLHGLTRWKQTAFRKATEQKKTVKKPSVPGAGPGRPSNFTKKAAADAAAAASAAAAAASADAGPTKGKGKEVKRVEIGEEEEGGATAVDAVQDVVDGVEGEGQEKMLVDDRAEGEEEEEEPYRTEDEEQEEQEEEEESEEEDEDGEEEVDEEEQARIDARGLEGASKDAIEED